MPPNFFFAGAAFLTVLAVPFAAVTFAPALAFLVVAMRSFRRSLPVAQGRKAPDYRQDARSFRSSPDP